MALYNLIGRRRCPQVAEKLRVNVLQLHFKRLFKFSAKVLIKTKINIDNELNFSDVCRSVNFIGSLA